MTLAHRFLRLFGRGPFTFYVLVAEGRHLVFTSEQQARGYASEFGLPPYIYPLKMTKSELRRSLK